MGSIVEWRKQRKESGRMVEITQCRQQRENRPERKYQQSLRGLWDKTYNIHVIWVPEREEKNGRAGKAFKELMAETFQIWQKTKSEIQGAEWQAPNTINGGEKNPFQDTSWSNFWKGKANKNIFKAAKEKRLTYKGKTI